MMSATGGSVSTVFGRVARDRRKALALSQQALADAANINRTFLSQIERGVRQPTITTLFKLADALDVEPAALIEQVEVQLGMAPVEQFAGPRMLS